MFWPTTATNVLALLFLATPLMIGGWMIRRVANAPGLSVRPGVAALGVWLGLLLLSILLLLVIAGHSSSGIEAIIAFYLIAIDVVCAILVWNLYRK